MNSKRWIILLIAAVLVTGAVSILLTRKIVLDKVDKGEIYIKADSYDEILDIYELRNIKKLIGEYYYKDIDFEKILREGASYGMVRELSDGYSSYYPTSRQGCSLRRTRTIYSWRRSLKGLRHTRRGYSKETG